ncbi:MAG TPA: hypothetical protein PLS00_05580, partial [Niabella sp.]|nr:hypothetical protein [Niabella sp.]
PLQRRGIWSVTIFSSLEKANNLPLSNSPPQEEWPTKEDRVVFFRRIVVFFLSINIVSEGRTTPSSAARNPPLHGRGILARSGIEVLKKIKSSSSFWFPIPLLRRGVRRMANGVVLSPEVGTPEANGVVIT